MRSTLYNKNLLILQTVCDNELLEKLDNENLGKSKFSINFSNEIIEISYNGELLHSKRRPNEQAERQVKKWIDKNDINDATRVTVLGLAPFFHIQYLIKLLPNNSIIRIVDEDIDLLIQLMQYVDFSFIEEYSKLKSIKFFINNDYTTLKEKIVTDSAYAEYSDIPLVRNLFRHPISFKFYNNLLKYVGLIENLNEIYLDYGVSDHERRLKNVFENLHRLHLLPPINCLKNQFTGINSVFVASGPSLNRTINWLKSNKDNLLILCANSTLPILLKHNITPHFVIQIDSSEERLKHIINLPKIQSYYISYPVLHSDFYDFYENKAFLYSTGYPEILEHIQNKFSLKCDRLQVKLTVALTGINFAEYLGCDKVYLLGVDMGFSEDNMYARGVQYKVDKTIQTKREQLIDVFSNEGKKIKTTIDYKKCIEELEAYFKKGASIKILHCSDTGVNLKGIDSISEQDLLNMTVDKNNTVFIDTLDNLFKKSQNDLLCYEREGIIETYCKKSLDLEEEFKKYYNMQKKVEEVNKQDILVQFIDSNPFVKMLISCINLEVEMQKKDFSIEKIFKMLIKKSSEFIEIQNVNSTKI